jgi:hypothetical protein
MERYSHNQASAHTPTQPRLPHSPLIILGSWSHAAAYRRESALPGKRTDKLASFYNASPTASAVAISCTTAQVLLRAAFVATPQGPTVIVDENSTPLDPLRFFPEFFETLLLGEMEGHSPTGRIQPEVPALSFRQESLAQTQSRPLLPPLSSANLRASSSSAGWSRRAKLLFLIASTPIAAQLCVTERSHLRELTSRSRQLA